MLAYTRTMSQYNQWMNERLLMVCDELSEEQMQADRGAFFKSILGTWNHILVGDLIWLRRLSAETDLPIDQTSLEQVPVVERLDQMLFEVWPEFKAKRRQIDQVLLHLSRDLKPQQLELAVTFTTTTGQSFQQRVWLILTHLFNHQTHHRGQLTDLIHQCGVNPGVTDLMAMCREQALAKHIG